MMLRNKQIDRYRLNQIERIMTIIIVIVTKKKQKSDKNCVIPKSRSLFFFFNSSLADELKALRTLSRHARTAAVIFE